MEEKRGTFTLIYSGMFGGKTAELAEIATFIVEFGNRKVLVVMPARDTRRAKDKIVSLSGASAPAIQAEDPFDILALVEKQQPLIKFSILPISD